MRLCHKQHNVPAHLTGGKLEADGEFIRFNYGRSYLKRADAISVYDPELPLRPGVLPLVGGLNIPSCIRDAAPDAWGRRVIIFASEAAAPLCRTTRTACGK